jgi:hypothetical protein
MLVLYARNAVFCRRSRWLDHDRHSPQNLLVRNYGPVVNAFNSHGTQFSTALRMDPLLSRNLAQLGHTPRIE